MKIRFLILVLLTCFGCKSETSNRNYPEEKNTVEHIEFELPKFSNWIESYTDNSVKLHFDGLSSSKNMNTLGVYLTKSGFEKKNNIGTADIGDYAIFMIDKREQKYKFKDDDLERVYQVQKDKARIKSIEKEIALRKIANDTAFLSPNLPVQIEKYKPRENVITGIKLIRPYFDDPNTIIVYAYNLILIQNHLVYAGYYADLNGRESIEKVKKNNNLIISKFQEVNK